MAPRINVDADLTRPQPDATHILVHAAECYTANLPLADLLQDDVLLAYRHDGEPLPREHGGPLRLVVPKLYARRSVKWVHSLEFLPRDRPGLWEQNGYHIYGDPWKEQRFDSD